MKMKRNFMSVIVLSVFLIILPAYAYSQSKANYKNYLESLPRQLKLVEKTPQKYLMLAEYFNRDIYGEVWSKVKVRGEYTRGLENGYACWNKVFIAHSKSQSELYLDSIKQEYMENMKYVPSPKMLEESTFDHFPKNTDNIFSRNLIWDMMAIEGYAWNYFDSLQLNKIYLVTDIHGTFSMASIGNYNQTKIELNWIGISMMNNKLCALIEYRALDNKLELNMNEIKSKGSEIYWGKTWVSMENKQIEYAEMYSNTIQEMEIQGLPDKILVNTKRVLKVERIQ